MEANQLKDAPRTEATGARKPERVTTFHEGDVWCDVLAFENTGRNGKPWTNHTVTISKSFKDGSGKWRSTKYFSLDDLGAVISVAGKAAEFLRGLKPQEER